MRTEALRKMMENSIALLEAVARGDTVNARSLAIEVRDLSWSHALPGLASAAGAFEQSVARGASSEAEMRIALQSIAYEIQRAIWQNDDGVE